MALGKKEGGREDPCLCLVLYTLTSTSHLQPPSEAASTACTSQISKTRLREGQTLAQGHTAGVQQKEEGEFQPRSSQRLPPPTQGPMLMPGRCSSSFTVVVILGPVLQTSRSLECSFCFSPCEGWCGPVTLRPRRSEEGDVSRPTEAFSCL